MFSFSILSCLPEIYVSLYTVPCKNCWNFYSLIFLMRLCYFHKDIGLVVFRYLKFFHINFFSSRYCSIYMKIFRFYIYILIFFTLIELGVHFFYCLHCPCSSKDISILAVWNFFSPCSILCYFYMYVDE